MQDQNKASETPEIDLTKYVPKDEVEKAQATVKSEKDKLASELEQAKLSLLDPEYIAYLEDKKAKAARVPGAELPKDGDLDFDKLTPKQLLNLALQESVKQVEARLDGRFKRSEQALSDVLAHLELRAVQEKYDDFEDYREDIAKLLEDSKSQLTIEQAYKQVKFDNPKAKEADDKSKEAPKGRRPSGEKPTGSHPAEGFQPKHFKDKTAAALDAWDQVVGAGKDSL